MRRCGSWTGLAAIEPPSIAPPRPIASASSPMSGRIRSSASSGSAALALAAPKPWRVEKADAADWAEARLAAPPAGQAGVLFHTIVWQYLQEETQRRIRIAIERAAARATSEAPLAWLRMEAEGDPDGAAVRLSIWPGGDDRRIARADFHGRWARWL